MIAEDIRTAIAHDRRTFIKKVLGGTIAGSLLLVFPATAAWPGKDRSRRLVFLVDITACIGCGSCCVADRSAYHVPAGTFRTWVERYVIDHEGNVSIDSIEGGSKNVMEGRAMAASSSDEVFFVPKLCRMCEEPPCRNACRTGATYRTRDGFVLIDSTRCTGCSSCVEACPHSVCFLDPQTERAAKCTWCYHLVQKGLLPVCVTVCPVQARIFGDLDDRESEVFKILHDPRLIPVRNISPFSRSGLYYAGWRSEVI